MEGQNWTGREALWDNWAAARGRRAALSLVGAALGLAHARTRVGAAPLGLPSFRSVLL